MPSEFVFVPTPYSAELQEELAKALRARTEIISRKMNPKLWRMTDGVNRFAEANRADNPVLKRRKTVQTVLSVVLAAIGVFLLVTGLTEPRNTTLLAAGVFLMIEKKNSGAKNERSLWLPYAIGSALFAALTSILAKVGISNVESNLGTAIRTGVVLVMAWLIVFMKGKQSQVKSIDKTELVFIALSGLATGGSWLCYYYAIQNGIVSVVVPIDKLSILISIGFSYFVFKEKLTKKAFAGLLLMVCGTLAMAIWA